MKKLIVFVLVTISLIGSVFATGVIDIAYSPYTVNNPGSYIVVKDLTTAQDLNCITINTSNITIDLNGHTLYGPGATTGTSGFGITANASQNSITITNGIVKNFGGMGIYLSGNAMRIEKIKVLSNASTGIYMGLNGIVENCQANYNGGIGIFGQSGSSIKGNNASNNTLSGISTGISVTVINNIANSNSVGIVDSGYSIIRENVATYNTLDGIQTGFGTIAEKNTASANGRFGINDYQNCHIFNNQCYNNSSSGILCEYSSLVKDNECSFNSVYGIAGFNLNRIEGNEVISNSTAGIYISGAGNSVVRNLSGDNGIGLFSVGSGNIFEENRTIANGTAETLNGSIAGSTLSTALEDYDF